MTTSRRLPSLLPISRWWNWIQNQPLPETEESIIFRVLVQLLAIVGIVAVDIAAADSTDPTWMSLWAVPVSVIGAIWSWHRRRKKNVPMKFCIAIAMLISLGLFFVNLLRSTNDTRLVLAGLLIQLQVFHSFDLPRRKDLGYSVVIGLILLAVAATVSQTFMFAPLLIVFLAIALPTLILDYRSRLGLLPQKMERTGNELSLKRLGIVLLITSALGLTIFAFLPRFPGYQLRNFPVSSPIDFPGEFDPSEIVNPGYVQEGSGGTGTGGEGTATGPGQVDDESYYGFSTQMNQNLRGTMTPKVVMRVRSQAPGFWRVMAFDRYTGQGWEVSRNEEDQFRKVERGTWRMRFLLPWTPTISRTREIVQTYTIVADLPNLIPALYEAQELYFPTREVAVDNEGALRSPVSLSDGLTYSVISEVPYRDRTQLRQSPTTYPPFIQDYYLEIPVAIRDRIRRKTEEILTTSPTPLTDSYEKAFYLAQSETELSS
jgi:TgpA N-terminal domain